MHWRELPTGMDFDSVKHRDFIIDSILKIGVFDELRDNFLSQRKSASTLLQLPSLYIREVGQYLSKYEKTFDREFENPTGRLPVERSKETQTETPALWYRYWLDHLDKLKQSIQAYIEAGVDFESINRHVWSETRQLVMRAGVDAYRYRVDRYAKTAGKKPKWVHRLIWWFRTLALEWKWSKKKILYGNYERYDTDQAHDPAKLVTIHCGYCGGLLKDNSLRPTSSYKFEPNIFDVSKGKAKVTVASTSSITHYDKPTQCPKCHELLENAYINKVARAVMVVLL